MHFLPSSSGSTRRLDLTKFLSRSPLPKHEAGRVSAALGPEVMASPAASSSTSDHLNGNLTALSQQPPFTSNSSQQASSQTSTEVSTSPSTTILRTNKGRSLKNYLPNRSNAKSLPSLAASLPLSFAPATSASTSPFPPLVATGQQSPFYSAHPPHLVSGSHPGLLVPLSSIGLPVPAEGGYMVLLSLIASSSSGSAVFTAHELMVRYACKFSGVHVPRRTPHGLPTI
jgi:hypothetical protein